jgi:hypothetical protein
VTAGRRPEAKAIAKSVFFNQERKSEVRRRLDTALVLTVNYAILRFGEVIYCFSEEHPGNESFSVPGVVWLQS